MASYMGTRQTTKYHILTQKRLEIPDLDKFYVHFFNNKRGDCFHFKQAM